MNNLLCPHCSKELKRANTLAIHARSCKLNPAREPHKGGFRKGYVMSDEVLAGLGWETIRVRWAEYQRLDEDAKARFRFSLFDKIKQHT